MRGREKEKKGLRIDRTKMHRKVLHKNIYDITKSMIYHLAWHGGVNHIGGLVYKETKDVLRIFLENMICDAINPIKHARCKTMIVMDVVYTLKR